jgi:hypothetical protein
MVPFPKYPSIACLATDPSTNGTSGTTTDAITDEDQEWREVEVEMRLNNDGKIIEPGEELDNKEEPNDDDDNNSNSGAPSAAPEPSQVFSRVTHALPPESIITIYGVKNSSASQEQHNSGDGFSGQGVGGADSSRSRARSPHKRFFKSRGKKSQNDWWTTTIRVVEQRPKRPVMGLLDVHTGQPHVRRDTQSTMAVWETADDLADWPGSNKRQKSNGSHADHEVDTDLSCQQSRTIMTGPGLCRPGTGSVNDTILIETIFKDGLSQPSHELLPGMWDFRSIDP